LDDPLENPYYSFIKVYEEAWRDENDNEFKVKVFSLNERWIKIRNFIDGLMKYHEHGNLIRKDIVKVKEVLLNTMTEQLKKTGYASYRMCYYALNHAKFLIEENNGDLKHLSECLARWCEFTLENYPRLGYEFKNFTFNIIKRCLKSNGDIRVYLLFLWRLATELRLIGYPKELDEIEELVKRIDGDETVKAWKIITLSAVAIAKRSEKDFKELVESANKLKGILRDYVIFMIKLYMVEIYLWRSDKRDILKAEKILKDLLPLINKILKRKNELIDCFSIYSRHTIKTIERFLMNHKALAYYHLAKALMDRNNIKSALDNFKKAEKIYKKLGYFAYALKCECLMNRIKAIENIEKSDFRNLFEKIRENVFEHDMLFYSQIIAENIVCEGFHGKKPKWSDLDILISMIRTITLGILSLFYDEFKRDAERNLKEFEIEYVKSRTRIEDKEKILKEKPRFSAQAFGRILRFYVKGEISKAISLAEEQSIEYQSKVPLLSRLYSDLAKVLREGNKREIQKAFLRLFYYHF
jgi:hypothetical protein